MKCFLFLFLCSLSYTQTFQSLDGFENEQGETILLYRLGDQDFSLNPIYKFNTVTKSEELIIDAFSTAEGLRACIDFEYFPADTSNFMNVGQELLGIDPIDFIARNDTIIYSDLGLFRAVDILKENPACVFAFGNGIYRSFDGGLSFPQDSIIDVDYTPLSVSQFENNIYFGINQQGKLVKNSSVLDTTTVLLDKHFKVIYDPDQLHIYIVHKTYWHDKLLVSNDKGNSFSWEFGAEYITMSSDQTTPGTIYVAEKNQIYKSTDFGYSFTEYHYIENNIVGIYKKPGSEVLYAATANRIFAITPDTLILVKTLPVPQEELSYWPLNIGNRWVYKIRQGGLYCFTDSMYQTTRITKDTIISGRQYYKFEPPLGASPVNAGYRFIRIDTLYAVVKVLNQSISDSEIAIYDFFMQPGDVVFFDPDWSVGFVLDYEDSILAFNKFRVVRYLKSTDYHFTPQEYRIMKGIGYYYDVYCSLDLGGFERTLVACEINGVVFGDSTLLGVNDTQISLTKFLLFQNYPNPCNPLTKIKYQTGSREFVIIKVYDMLGQEIETLVNEEKPAGMYELNFNGSGLASGVYLYKMTAGEFVQTKKIILLR